MKIRQQEMNNAYVALGSINLDKVAPIDIAKIMRARKEMRPYVEAYKAFDEDVRKAQPNYDILAELEQKGKARTEAEEQKFKDLLPAFVEAVNIALGEELAKEYDLPFEPISEESVAQIVSNNGLSLAALEVIKCITE